MSPRSVPALLNKLPSFRRRALLLRLRYMAWRHGATIKADIPSGVRVGKRINIEVKKGTTTTLSVGPGTMIGDDVLLRLYGGSMRLGNRVDVRARVILNVGGGDLVIDGPSNLGWGVAIHCAESVTIQKHAQIAEYSTIADNSHFHSEPDKWSYYNSRTAPIALGVDVWVCPKCTITGGVTIGDYTIVASNSVVIKDAPSGVLVSGVPGKVVRELDLPWKR
jgi:acetyltransferase-like isoleucine patch superfamily enzyme